MKETEKKLNKELDKTCEICKHCRKLNNKPIYCSILKIDFLKKERPIICVWFEL